MSSYRGMTKKIKNDLIKFKRPDVYLDGLIIQSTKYRHDYSRTS